MIGLLAWPQLSIAAGFVAAVAVVLNPVMPILPDITVPALFPPVSGSRSSVPAQSQPPAAAIAVVPAAGPSLAVPAVPAASAVSRAGPEVPPAYATAPTGVAPAPILSPSDIEMPTAPEELRTAVPMAGPVVHVQSPPLGIMAHAGDRLLPAFGERLGAKLNGPKPLPAAVVDSPETPPPDGGAVRSRGRVGSPRPDTTNPAPRGHRGSTDPD